MMIGATYLGNGKCSFRVWAPEIESMWIHIVQPEDRTEEMKKTVDGYFSLELGNVFPGTKYFLSPGGQKDLPDPASHYQPEGVHGASEVIDHSSFSWSDDNWKGIPFSQLILYELHVGTFTEQGSFEAIISKLDDLKEIGINAIELMPVVQFPGERNWGYDGACPFAIQNSYGGPSGLKKLVNACHAKGIAVFLDVVYNHLGPEGNYLPQFAPYFTKKYHVTWGDAINFDGPFSDGVREYFSDNAVFLIENYHLDGLRLDAIHGIYDSGAVHFWELFHKKINELQQKLGRSLHTIAESDFNNPRVVKSPEAGGFGFTAQWLDDFHHALYVPLHHEGKKLYEDFGHIEQLAKAYNDGFVHSGEYVKARKKRHGRTSAGVPGNRFVVFTDNHDQAGNRVTGDRLSMLLDFESLKIASAAMLLSPYVPMLFMGEEFGADTPFLYFVSHSDKKLCQLVREGRKKEFEAFNWETDPPDPDAIQTFTDSKLNWNSRLDGRHAIMLNWYSTLINLRKTHPCLQSLEKTDMRVNTISERGLFIHRQTPDGLRHIYCFLNFSKKEFSSRLPDLSRTWKKILTSKDARWMEKKNETFDLPDTISAREELLLPPLSVVVYESV